jgi:hypothetical protein
MKRSRRFNKLQNNKTFKAAFVMKDEDGNDITIKRTITKADYDKAVKDGKIKPYRSRQRHSWGVAPSESFIVGPHGGKYNNPIVGGK